MKYLQHILNVLAKHFRHLVNGFDREVMYMFSNRLVLIVKVVKYIDFKKEICSVQCVLHQWIDTSRFTFCKAELFYLCYKA